MDARNRYLILPPQRHRYSCATLLAFACIFLLLLPEAGAAPRRESGYSLAAIKEAMASHGPDAALEAFLGLPYRNDGALTQTGEYTLFADSSRRFATPGLNCSGFVLAACRLLLGSNTSVDQAKADRLGDSGPGAPDGEDWDFGWDLILNVSEGFPRRFLLPGNALADPETCTGHSPRGYDIQKAATWDELPGRLRPDSIYLVSLTVEGRLRGYGLQHYHVGLIRVTGDGKAWFYQTTGKGGGVNRRDLNSPEGRDSFKKAFSNTGKKRKMMLVLEVDTP